jgi:hypothetical protein
MFEPHGVRWGELLESGPFRVEIFTFLHLNFGEYPFHALWGNKEEGPAL